MEKVETPCPTCNGSGRHDLVPPRGFYVRLRAEINSIASDETRYAVAENRLEELARLGYELHSFQEDGLGTTWMMQWPTRWR